MSEGLKIVGKRFTRRDAYEKVTGQAKFVSDMQLPRMLYAKFLRSPYAHARIKSINTARAEALPGVKAVITYKDVPRIHPLGVRGQKLGYILDETLRYAGQELAAVAATTGEIAEEALTLIEVEYEILPAVFDKEEALKPGAPIVRPEVKGNLYPGPKGMGDALRFEWGDLDKGFAEADEIIEGKFESPMQYNCSPEPRAAICQWMGDNLTCWASTQVPNRVQGDLAQCLGIPQSRVRVIAEYPVGGYGAKDPEVAATLAAMLARKTGKPVKAVFSRAEDFIATHRSTDATINIRLGVKKDGEITAMHAKWLTNFGQDSKFGWSVPSVAASNTFSGLYRYKNSRFEGRQALTNIANYGPRNGFGDPEAAFGIERLTDEAAERIDMDPVAFRLKNCVRAGDRAISAGNVVYGDVKWGILSSDLDSFPECIRQAAEKADWKNKWKGWKTPMAVNGPKRRGIGIAVGMHHCATPPADSARVTFNNDGSVMALSMDPDIGQGLRTAMAQVVAEAIGLRLEDVNVTLADTGVTPLGGGVVGSRGTTLGINAAYLAALDARRKLLTVAAKRLGVKPEDLNIKDGRIYVTTEETKGITTKELCETAPQIWGAATVPLPFIDQATGKEVCPKSVAATIAEVEVDTETGELDVLRITSAHDCGKAINPTMVENQISLSATMASGWVRTEEFIIDKKRGIVLNPNLLDYKLLTFVDMPKNEDFRKILIEYPFPFGAFGAKGMSETAHVTMGPALANAIYNAIGVRIRGNHLDPEKILQALSSQEVRG